jgi:hypothetical protein
MAGNGGISECFVAREDELSALHGALREARDGRPVVVAIEGEPGIDDPAAPVPGRGA